MIPAFAPVDVDLVNLCAAIYRADSAWDYFDAGDDDGVCFGLRKRRGHDTIVFRGSVSLHDWYEDFRATPIATRIGTVHAGFYDGIEKMWVELRPMLTQAAMVTGHSLGAARADILCGLMVAAGRPPLRRTVFGEPRPGMADFCRLIADIPGGSARNADARGHDRVTDVPIELPPEFEVDHPTALIDVTASPPDDLYDCLDWFAYHHVELYQAAMQAAVTPPIPSPSSRA